MSDQSLNADISSAVLQTLEEAFEQVQGIFLDKNTSIFETLASISAAQASQPNAGGCATIAAHVAHMDYYIQLLIRVINGERPQADWQQIWRTVSAVTEEEWAASQQALRGSYQQMREIASGMTWQNAHQIGGAIALVAHSAYHLGEIRQMLCHIRGTESSS